MLRGKICGSLAPALMKGAAKCFLSDQPRMLKVQGGSRWRLRRPSLKNLKTGGGEAWQGGGGGTLGGVGGTGGGRQRAVLP